MSCAKARGNVCAGFSRVKSMFVRSEEIERGKVGVDIDIPACGNRNRFRENEGTECTG